MRLGPRGRERPGSQGDPKETQRTFCQSLRTCASVQVTEIREQYQDQTQQYDHLPLFSFLWPRCDTQRSQRWPYPASDPKGSRGIFLASPTTRKTV